MSNSNRSMWITLGALALAAVIAGATAGQVGGMILRGAGRGPRPFQQKVDFISSASPSFTVPPGRELVLTYAAARIVIPAGQEPLLSIKTTVRGVTVEYQLAVARQATNVSKSETFVASQPLSAIYADGGTEVVVSAQSARGGSFTGEASISGHLVEPE